MDSLNFFLNNFLDIINYPDGKDEFRNKFINAAYLKAIDDLIANLSSDKQEDIRVKIKTVTSPEMLQDIVSSNFEKNSFEQALKASSQKLFIEYSQTIDDILTQDQKVKLQEFYNSQNTVS